MDDDLKQLEDELRRCRPMGVSPAFMARIQSDLRPRPRNWAAWIPLPGLIALAIGAAALFRQPAGLEGTSLALTAVSANSVTTGTPDDGYVTLADGSIVKRTHQTAIDTVTWKDSKAGASLTWSVPREEVTVTPISFQ